MDCDNGNVQVDPHFNQPTVPVPTLYDPDSTVTTHCGDLVFDNRTRSFTFVYATAQASESPWKYWWRRGRSRTDGTGLGLIEVRKVSVPQYQYDNATIAMPLSDQYDAVTSLLLIDSDSTFVLNDSAFTSVQGAGNPLFNAQNINVQHWRRIRAPVLNSAVVSGFSVDLTWTNNHQTRVIDSTNIYRDGVLLATRGPTVTTYPDNPGPGTYAYTLKHVSVKHGLLVSATPNSASSNGIQVTVGTACATAERLVTWQVADQYLSAGCSQGSGKRYRWRLGATGPWTAWTTDTLLDFAGNPTTGTHLVILEDSSTVTGLTSRETVTLTVISGQVSLSGPTYITDKKIKSYTATAGGSAHSGQWFERYDDGPQWYPATSGNQTSMTRIWPAGQYTVDLRQHRVLGSALHRGRLLITVCNTPGCGPAAPPAQAGAPAPPVESWGLFGGGPWISWGTGSARQTLRLYDLWGMHDLASAFVSADWIDGAGGTASDPGSGWTVRWAPLATEHSDIRRFAVTVTGGGMRPYVFGFGLDPDLGPNAADDVAAYDPARNLVIVTDGRQAVGYLLQRGDRNALARVREYGVGRFAPTTPAAAWSALREGSSLVGTPRDVQLLLAAAETLGDATWELVMIRGATAADVRATADALSPALR